MSAVLLVLFILILSCEQASCQDSPYNITYSQLRRKKTIDHWWYESSGSLTTNQSLIDELRCPPGFSFSRDLWKQNKFLSVRRKIQRDNMSKLFQPVEYKSPPSGQTSSTGFEVYQAIYIGVIILALVITVVSFKCYIDWRLRRVNNGAENEHEPLRNQNGDPCIPMADLNVNRTHMTGELQASDLGHSGITDSNRDLLEGQRKSQSKGMTGSQNNDSFHAAGQFCRCCDLHRTRCKKSNKEPRIAPVQPQQSVNEMPTTETAEAEMLEDRYSDFSSSIFHHPESHGSTSTVDEETTHVKSVYSNEQVSSTVEQTNEAEGTCFEESLQPGLHNEDHMTTGMPAEDDLSQAHSLLGRTNHDEE